MTGLHAKLDEVFDPTDAAQKLGLLSWHNLAPERELFVNDLLGRLGI